jgi:D-arabinose 1-dehydrogenase-like Zn-dependent alcohol dehydrogenase
VKGAVLYGKGDVRFEERPAPTITKPTDALIRISATCVCGSDLWPYRGISPFPEPTPMGHEYCGIVEEIGSSVTSVKPGQFVIGSFFASDNTCPNCQVGYQSSCQHREFVGTAQAPMLRVPLTDGTLRSSTTHHSADWWASRAERPTTPPSMACWGSPRVQRSNTPPEESASMRCVRESSTRRWSLKCSPAKRTL